MKKNNKKQKNVGLNKLLKWAIRTATAVLVLLLAAVLVLWLYIRKTIPDWSGEIEIVSLSKPVNIIRDNYGMPHIYAETEEDLYFAAGFVHASERLFQMDISRRYAAGTLAEILGKRSVTSDKKMRVLNLQSIVYKGFNSTSEKIRRYLEKYAEGVNYVIENGPVPLEYKMLDCRPDKWKPMDSLLVWLGLGWDLSGTGGELTNGVIFNSLGRNWTGFLRDNRTVNADDDKSVSKDIYRIPGIGIPDSSLLNWAIKKRWDKPSESLPSGSGWVIAGSRTKSGKPLLVSDFNLDASIPTKFYTMQISVCEKTVSGAFLPGVPFPLMGYNGKIAWGVSPLGADAVDYREFALENSKSKSIHNLGILASLSEDIIKAEEIIKAKDDSPKKIRQRFSDFGNCINVDQKEGPFLAVLWTGKDFSTDFDALYEIGVSENKQKFLAAISNLSLPHFNVVFADFEGNIGYFPSGKLPDRSNYSGALPLKAGRGTEWVKYLDEKEKPLIMNPERGYIIASGSAIPDKSFADKVTTDREFPFKVERIERMLSGRKTLAAEDMAEILNDTYSVEAETLLNAFKNIKLDNPWLADLLERLSKWNKRYEGGSEPAIYLAFRQQLPWFVISDDIREVDPKMTSFSNDRIAPLLRAMKLRSFAVNYPEVENRNWFGDRRTPGAEDEKTIIKYSLSATSAYLSKYFTNRWEEQQWDYFHTVDFLHPLWRTKLAERLFCRRSVGIAGGQDTVFNTMWWKNYPFRAKRIPAFRMIIDLGDPDNSLMIKNMGQSANPFSRGFRDEMKMMLNGEFKPLPFTRESVEKEKDEELILLPAEE
jgi:penicillin amidase